MGDPFMVQRIGDIRQQAGNVVAELGPQTGLVNLTHSLADIVELIGDGTAVGEGRRYLLTQGVIPKIRGVVQCIPHLRLPARIVVEV